MPSELQRLKIEASKYEKLAEVAVGRLTKEAARTIAHDLRKAAAERAASLGLSNTP